MNYYDALLIIGGNVSFGMVDKKPVAFWNGLNPILVSQRFVEEIDWNTSDMERLPDKSFRICQYQLEFIELIESHEALIMKVVPLPENEISPEYWERFKQWREDWGLS